MGNRSRWNLFLAFMYILKKYRWKTGINIFCTLVYEVCIIIAAGLSSYMVSLALLGKLNEQNQQWIYVLGVSVLLFGIFRYLEGLVSHDVAFRILVDYRKKMYQIFEKVCPDILLKNKSGQISLTLMNDVEILEWFFGHTVGSMVATLAIVVGILGFMLWLHLLLFLLMLLSVLVIFSIPFFFRKQADSQGLLNRYKLGDANSVTLEGLNGVKEILAFDYKDTYLTKNTKFMDELTCTQVDYTKRQGKEGGFLVMAAGVFSITINLQAIYLVFQGALSLEWFAVIGTSIWLVYNPILALCDKARSFGIIFGSARRVYELLEAEPLIKDTGQDLSISNIEPSIQFEEVFYQYSGSEQPALHAVNFSIAANEMVALVGKSGAGKTTTTNLLMRYWDVKQGAIRIGGYDLKDFSLKSLRGMVSAVMQDVYLFNTTILENIRLGNPNASIAEVIEAAKDAQAHEFICEMEAGYQTIVGERGGQLSGGQKQRISIARALLTKSPILIFDEAVANLDTQSEREIQKVLARLSQQKTIIMVAHRLSTILMADRILVFENGQVVECGQHEELIRHNGVYKDLIASQIQG